MTANMPTSTLPKVISDYLAASEKREVDGIVACFSDDAVVFDDSKHGRGPAEIRRWREDVDTAFEYTTTVTGWTAHGDTAEGQRYDVTVHLQGNFPGGEVDLVNRFIVRDDRIVDLRIDPATS